MLKNIINLAIIALVSLVITSGYALAAISDAALPKKLVWPFEGIFGSFDRQSAQRGAQVYFEVCGQCHGIRHLYYRNLEDIGFSKEEIKEIAKKYNIKDGPNADGEMFDRPAKPFDNIVSPYPNEQAARASNNGALPPDLSLIIKARHDGANYLYSLLTGYQEKPEHIDIMEGLYYNPYFEGKGIAMPPPLTDHQVEYIDGTPATIEQMARDVTIFLQYAAEPEMEHRKSLGLKVMIFLSLFTLFFYIVMKRIWKDIK